MDRRQIATVLVLQELGIEPKLDLFRDRLVVQKAIYLAQAAGCDLGYYYGWYLRGPYCSPLARDMFATVEDLLGFEEAVRGFELDADSRECLTQVKELIAPPTDPHAFARRLELLASVHFLIKREQVPESTPSAVAQRLKLFGKDFDAKDVAGAIDGLRRAGLLNAA